jgi:Rrf2 family cysteine metabolism transcriptional repressor
MKFSTRARYGTRALLDLAIHYDEGPISLKDIANRQQISTQYLEHLITPLLAAGIIRSTRGPKGGVTLARAPKKIALNEVIRVLEGSTAPVDCVDDPKLCPRSELCVTRDIWDEMKQAMNRVLESTNLQDLVERQKVKNISKDALLLTRRQ